MKKPASKVAGSAQIQPKSQFLFHKNLPPWDFTIMTLSSTNLVPTVANAVEVTVFSEIIEQTWAG